ncbi:MAG TPA: sugar transferase [Microlunatus sp.]|nr:sugar transferase [Microlunatus sp.]
MHIPTKITTADDQLVRPGRRRYPWGKLSPLLRDGVRPMFVAGDTVACVGTATIVHAGGQSTLGVTIVMVALLAGGGLNRSRLSLSVLDDLPQIIRLWLVGAAFLVVASEVLTGSMQLVLLMGVLPALIAVRAVLYAVVRAGRRQGSVTHPTVVVGSGALGQLVVDALDDHPETGLRAVGFVDSSPLDVQQLAVPMLGEPIELAEILVRTQARALIVAHGGLSEADLVRLVRNCQRQQCEVFVLPRLHEITHVAQDMDAVGDLPLIRLRRSAYRSPSWRIKRVLDVVVSALAIVLLSPLLAALALAVRWETGRGVLFRQQRVGRDGIAFELLKFRSMKPVDEAESQTNWNISQDNRVGPVGRLIRKTSLDELPQLFNILRGDMSLVGPRPERPHFVEQFGELYTGYADRHRVPCGLTGWAQIHGLRGNTPIDQRARFDNFYIENWTFWLDVKIILRTVVSVFTKPGS